MTLDRPGGTPPFDRFVDVEFEQVLSLALAILRDGDDAVEVAQETMLRALEHWDDVSELDRPGAWSRRVALNLVNDRLRGRARRRRLMDRLRTQRGTPTASADVWDAAFWEHVARLPRRQRDVIALHYVLDLPVAEIAGIVEVAVGTVKSDLSRARDRLRASMGSGEEPST